MTHYLLFSRTLHIDFRTNAESGMIFLVGNLERFDMVSVYLRHGHLMFARRCGSGRASEIFRDRMDDNKWHSVSICGITRWVFLWHYATEWTTTSGIRWVFLVALPLCWIVMWYEFRLAEIFSWMVIVMITLFTEVKLLYTCIRLSTEQVKCTGVHDERCRTKYRKKMFHYTSYYTKTKLLKSRYTSCLQLILVPNSAYSRPKCVLLCKYTRSKHGYI